MSYGGEGGRAACRKTCASSFESDFLFGLDLRLRDGDRRREERSRDGEQPGRREVDLREACGEGAFCEGFDH